MTVYISQADADTQKKMLASNPGVSFGLRDYRNSDVVIGEAQSINNNNNANSGTTSKVYVPEKNSSQQNLINNNYSNNTSSSVAQQGSIQQVLDFIDSRTSEMPADLKAKIDGLTYSGTMTDAEIRELAETLAAERYDSTFTSLNNNLGTLKTDYENTLNTIDATYTNTEAISQRLLEEAAEDALKSSVARGGGRSGLVEYLTGKLQVPVMEQTAQAQANIEAAKTNALNTYNTSKQSIADTITALTKEKGDYTASTIADKKQSIADAESQFNLNKASLYAQANAAARSGNTGLLSSILPYAFQTQDQKAQSQAQAVSTMGSTGNNTVSLAKSALDDSVTSSSNAMVGLRNYLENNSKSVDWDSGTGNVTIGSLGNYATLTPDVLKGYGGQLQNGSWMLPQSSVDEILKKYGI